MDGAHPESLELARPLKDGKVMRGKDGWLFLANDVNRVLEQHTGRLPLTGQQLDQWQSVLEERIAVLTDMGPSYHFLVAPNAHSVYSEMLPDEIEQSARRPVLQLIEHLEQSGSPARVIYPIEELKAEKPRRDVFAKTASHWNSIGAFVAYRRLIEAVTATVPARAVDEEQVEFLEDVRPSDLGFKLDPPECSTNIFARVREPRTRVLSDNLVLNHGRLVEFECGEAPETRCLVFGDSFAVPLLPFFAESFRRFVFAHLTTVDFDFVEEEQPDVVISLINERFLVRVPRDYDGFSFREIETGKLARGETTVPWALWPAGTAPPGGASPQDDASQDDY